MDARVVERPLHGGPRDRAWFIQEPRLFLLDSFLVIFVALPLPLSLRSLQPVSTLSARGQGGGAASPQYLSLSREMLS